MTKKSVNDYLTEGLYGVQLPKDDERRQYLGTLRERIVIALTISQVISDSGLKALEKAMREHPNTKLILNGRIAYRLLKKEKEIADKYKIQHTTYQNNEHETDIGAVLTYDHAIHKEEIYIKEQENRANKYEAPEQKSLWDKLSSLF